jgi:hypothetical protein
VLASVLASVLACWRFWKFWDTTYDVCIEVFAGFCGIGVKLYPYENKGQTLWRGVHRTTVKKPLRFQVVGIKRRACALQGVENYGHFLGFGKSESEFGFYGRVPGKRRVAAKLHAVCVIVLEQM